MDTFTITDINGHSEDPTKISFMVKFKINGNIYGQCFAGIDVSSSIKILNFINAYAKELQNKTAADTLLSKEMYGLVNVITQVT